MDPSPVTPRLTAVTGSRATPAATSKTGLKLWSPRWAEQRACDNKATSDPQRESCGGWQTGLLEVSEPKLGLDCCDEYSALPV